MIMTVFSKILHPFTTTLSCHELAHTWTPSCSGAAAGIFRSCFVESVKIYGLLYLVRIILMYINLALSIRVQENINTIYFPNKLMYRDANERRGLWTLEIFLRRGEN